MVDHGSTIIARQPILQGDNINESISWEAFCMIAQDLSLPLMRYMR